MSESITLPGQSISGIMTSVGETSLTFVLLITLLKAFIDVFCPSHALITGLMS